MLTNCWQIPVVQVLAQSAEIAVAYLDDVLFQALALSHILRDSRHAINFPRLVPYREGAVADPPRQAVGPDDPVFFVIFSLRLPGGNALQNPRAIFIMDRVGPVGRRRI